jgi:hypothetical protein
MPTPKELTPDLVRTVIDYNSETGALTWKHRSADLFKTPKAAKAWNAQFAGKRAFTAKAVGYHQGAIFRRPYYAHRVAWAAYYGEWPQGSIDHINHCKTDNRICNLRDVSHQTNCRNHSLSTRNKSGATGVWWHQARSKWLAYIRPNGRKIHIGYFDDFSAAVAARAAFERKLGFHENHGRDRMLDEQIDREFGK